MCETHSPIISCKFLKQNNALFLNLNTLICSNTNEKLDMAKWINIDTHAIKMDERIHMVPHMDSQGLTYDGHDFCWIWTSNSQDLTYDGHDFCWLWTPLGVHWHYNIEKHYDDFVSMKHQFESCSLTISICSMD